MMLLSTLIATFGGPLRQKFGDRLLPGHHRALHAMEKCRTEESPVMIVHCPDCHTQETIPHSCGHRNCPHCQHHEGQQWLERQRGKLLPVDYFMVTFTLPYQLRQLVWQHQRIGYDLLLKLGWQTLMQFGLNDPQLKRKDRRTRGAPHPFAKAGLSSSRPFHRTGRGAGFEASIMAEEKGEVSLSS